MEKSLKTLILGFVITCLFLNFPFSQRLWADDEVTSEKENQGVMDASGSSGIEGKQGINRAAKLNIAVSSDEEETQSVDGSVSVIFSQEKKGFVYTKDGKEVVVSLQDIFGDGQSSFFSSWGIQDGDALTVTFETVDGNTVCFLTKYKNETQNKEWVYDVSSRQTVYFHTEGASAGKPDYVAQENGGWFRWADNNSADPTHRDQIIHLGLHFSDGRQFVEHFVAQKYFYDTDGNLTLIEFYTSTGGAGTEIGQLRVYGRYTYRVDTYDAAGERAKTVYYNDPYPGSWDPQIEGIIVRDSFGRYFLQENDGTRWLIIARKEGIQDGASSLNTLIFDQLVEDKTLVKLIGHEYRNDTIYFDQKQTRILAVTKGEIISPPPEEVPQARQVVDFSDYQSSSAASWQADSGNQQTIGLIVDNENPQDRAIVWEWERINSSWYGWGRVFADSAVLTQENLGNLVLKLAVSGNVGSGFTLILEDNANFSEVNGVTVGHEIVFNIADYLNVDYNLQLVSIPLNELAALNPDFDWSSIKQLKFTPSSDKGRVVIQQLGIEDVSAIRSRGLGLAVFQDNNFTPISDWYGVKPAYVMSFKDLFDILDEDILAQLQAVSNNNQIPYLTLEFWQMQVKSPEQMQIEKDKFVQRYGEGVYERLLADTAKGDILSGIRDGVYDPIIRDYAQAAAELNKPMLLRIFHEFNGVWYPWTIDGGKEDNFVAAWSRIYNIFQEEGASKVSFVFSPFSLNNQGYDPVERILSRLKDKIDIIAFDGYGPSPENPQSTGFSGLFTELYLRLEKYNLPFMIGEFGSELNKAEFYRGMDEVLRNGSFPHLIGVTYFDIAKFERGLWRDFGVSTIADAIRNIQQDSFYRLGFDAGIEFVKAYGEATRYYWGDYNGGDMQAEVFMNTPESGQKHITVSVNNNILSVSVTSNAGSEINNLDLITGILKTAAGDIIPYISPDQYKQNISQVYQLIVELSAQATGVEKEKSLAVANYLNAIIYRLNNPDVSMINMPLLPSSGTTDPSGKINIVFQNNTSLFPDQLADLWAEVKYDGKTEYWDLTPAMISSDGKSILMQFNSDFNGKSVAMRFYGFDKSGKQTSFSNSIVIQVDSSPSGVAMPILPSAGTTESSGKITLDFQNNTTLFPDQLSSLWAEVIYDGKTEYWILHPTMISTDGKSLTMQFNSDFNGKAMLMRFYGFDASGKQTGLTNQISINVVSNPSSVAMPVLPGTAATDTNRNVFISFVSGSLFSAALTQLWAEVSFDGKTEYWRLHPSMITPDGASIFIQFNAAFSGKTLRMRFYGFDLEGSQTAYTSPIDISVL